MPFSPAYHVVYGAYSEYLRSGDRIYLPLHKHNPANSVGKVHASALGRCPLQNALKRSNAPMTNPPSHQKRTSSLHLMQQGVRDAEPVQESLIWKYGKAKVRKGVPQGKGAAVEVSIDSKPFRVRGRMDAVVRPGEGREAFIFEVKRRDPIGGENDPQPKLSDVWQVLTYGLTTGIQNMNLVIMNRYSFKVWTLRPVTDGYMLFDEMGVKWDSFLNSPEHINIPALEREIQLQFDYLHGIQSECPMPDFLNDDRNGGWYCFQWVKGVKPMVYAKTYQGKDEKFGYITPRCEYFCQPMELIGKPIRETGRNTKRYEFVPETITEESVA